jgi:DNA modification methylase
VKAISEHDLTVYQGDVREQLAALEPGSVQCVVTSPPYFGLRDYGVDGQIGLEASPAEYVAELVGVFREVRRVLADDGVCWLNLGDSYTASLGQRKVTDKAGPKQMTKRGSTGAPSRFVEGLAPKNLLGIPWRVAFALQDDDSADVYELRADTPSEIVADIYLETCHTKTPRHAANITASTPGAGARQTPSGTENDAQHGTTPTANDSGDTAESTTNSTASKRSSGPSEATPGGTDRYASQPCSTTADPSLSVPAVVNGDCPSLPSTTSTVVAVSTEGNCEQPTSRSGSTSSARDTPKASASSVTTATAPVVTTAGARTKMRLTKAQIRPDWLPYFRLVKQDRWILRNSVIWAKPNAMPESVTDRLSTRYEHVFLLSKSRRYWFDLDAIREPLTATSGSAHAPQTGRGNSQGLTGLAPHRGFTKQGHDLGRNPGDVWKIATSPTSAAHFATMPPELARRCILAGCPERGTVLDPFAGSGTTLMVARKLGRKAVGVELNPDYIDIIRDRIGQTPLDFGETA